MRCEICVQEIPINYELQAVQSTSRGSSFPLGGYVMRSSEYHSSTENVLDGHKSGGQCYLALAVIASDGASMDGLSSDVKH
jgi:hypothetical protein